jgi:putative flippase GtrA
MRWLIQSPDLGAKIIRFGIVGGLSAAVFATTTMILVSGLGAGAVAGSLVGFLASAPMAFVGQRQFTFHSHGRWMNEAVRFVSIQCLNLLITVGGMFIAVDRFHASYYWGILATIILVPAFNFIISNIWVFRRQEFQA